VTVWRRNRSAILLFNAREIEGEKHEVRVKGKGKVRLEQATKAQRRRRVTALLFP
jgi:hypothetical protein